MGNGVGGGRMRWGMGWGVGGAVIVICIEVEWCLRGMSIRVNLNCFELSSETLSFGNIFEVNVKAIP